MVNGLTEAEAKVRWCPFSREVFEDNKGSVSASGNRPMSYIGGCQCIASDCMAWRWAGNDGEWKRRSTGILTPTPVGFCGLAEARTVVIKEKEK